MTTLKWWQTAVFYQIYPRSFADGNGDGIGDLQGLIARLDYLQDLGVDALWLSPHYPSPYADCGYDVSDYTGVAPEYGSLDDFKRFLDEAHQRGIRVVLDLVMNHSSDEHPWFIESRTSRDNPKRDWYMWRDGVDGGPPNDWYALFGGSAWEYDQTTEQYYYHFFLKEQPDLNWRNPEVKQAIWDAVRFWLDMGVDGFRLDAVGTIYEHPEYPGRALKMTQLEYHQKLWNATSSEEQELQRTLWRGMYGHQAEQPGVHELMQELRTLVNTYDDRVLIGEAGDIAYYGDGTNELHLAFNFPLMRTDRLTPPWIRTNQHERLTALPPGAWPCNTLNNHDTARVYSHFISGENGEAQARLLAALMLTLRGTPFFYNGEEIGMTDLMLENIEQFYDTPNIIRYHTLVNELGVSPEEALNIAAQLSRDRCRTPMQWADAPNGGFSPEGVQTWLPVNPNYAQGINVASQQRSPGSLLNFYREMIHLRKRTPALIVGDYVPLNGENTECLAFTRNSPAQRCLVVMNFSARPQELPLELDAPAGRVLFASEKRDATANLHPLKLAPFEVLIAEIPQG